MITGDREIGLPVCVHLSATKSPTGCCRVPEMNPKPRSDVGKTAAHRVGYHYVGIEPFFFDIDRGGSKWLMIKLNVGSDRVLEDAKEVSSSTPPFIAGALRQSGGEFCRQRSQQPLPS